MSDQDVSTPIPPETTSTVTDADLNILEMTQSGSSPDSQEASASTAESGTTGTDGTDGTPANGTPPTTTAEGDGDADSVKTEESEESAESSSSESGSESSSSSEDPSVVGGVKVEKISDSDNDEGNDGKHDRKRKPRRKMKPSSGQSGIEHDSDATSTTEKVNNVHASNDNYGNYNDEEEDDEDGEDEIDFEEEEEDEQAAVLLKSEVQAYPQPLTSIDGPFYIDEEEASGNVSSYGYGDVTRLMGQGTLPSDSGTNSTQQMGMERASVRKMMGQKMRGKGWKGKKKGRGKARISGDGGGTRRSRSSRDGPDAVLSHLKRRKILYGTLASLLMIVGVSLLIVGLVKERELTRPTASEQHDDFYDDIFGNGDEEEVESPAQQPVRPNVPEGAYAPSTPTIPKTPIHAIRMIPTSVPSSYPSDSPTSKSTPPPTTKFPTLSPTARPVTAAPTHVPDNALLLFLKQAYSEAFQNGTGGTTYLSLINDIFLNYANNHNMDINGQSMQWRAYMYLHERNDVIDRESDVLIMEDERILQIYALTVFYLSLNWSQEGAGECLWQGVTCREEDLRVIALDVGGDSEVRAGMPPLQGEMPVELMFLPYLETLDLSKNMMRGMLPGYAMVLWTDMITLSLHDNRFEGVIPMELGSLTKLRKLTLYHNEFLGFVPPEVCDLRDKDLHYLWVDCSPMTGTDIPKVTCPTDCCTICFEGYDSDGGPETGGTSPSSHVDTPHEVQDDLKGILKEQLSEASSDGGMSLLDIHSPQFHAYSWLVVDSANKTLSVERLLQRYGLATLFFSTAGDGWRSSDGWIDLNNECDWYGISGCDDPDEGEIVAIELFGNSLEGTIPPELFIFLPNVAIINLASNKLDGKIPVEIGMLKRVNILELAENQLSGPIPTELGKLEFLDHVFLQTNNLVGKMPDEVCDLRTEHQLTLLWADCEGNPARVECSRPCCTTCFSSEVIIDGSGGVVGGTPDDGTPDEGATDEGNEPPSPPEVPIGHTDTDGKIMALLKKMAPDKGASLGDALSPQYKAYSWLVESSYESISDILTLQRYALATLYFSTAGSGWGRSDKWMTDENECTWAGIEECNAGDMVTVLGLGSNNLVGTIPTELTHLRVVEIIDLSDNELYGMLPTEFGWFEELEVLSLGGNLFSGEIPSEIGNIFTLQGLYVHTNDFSGVFPENVCLLTVNGGLHSVWADCGDDPPRVECKEFCCTRCFDDNSFFIPYEGADVDSSYTPTPFPIPLPESNEQVPTPAPTAREMNENDELKEFLLLHMDGFEQSLSDENSNQYKAYLWLANMRGLENWNAEQRIQRFGMATFYLSTTVEMNWKVSNRWFSHEHACHWFGVTCADNHTVSEISLPHNRLSGTIPPEIALVGIGGNLVSLDLSENNIQGNLPTQLGTLKSLGVLDLRANDFSGEIPTELGHLTKLTSLKLHANEFIGEMPPEICDLRFDFLEDLVADCDETDPLDEVICDPNTCCTQCF